MWRALCLTTIIYDFICFTKIVATTANCGLGTVNMHAHTILKTCVINKTFKHSCRETASWKYKQVTLKMLLPIRQMEKGKPRYFFEIQWQITQLGDVVSFDLLD